MMEKIKGVFTRNIEAEKRGIVEDQKWVNQNDEEYRQKGDYIKGNR